MRFEVIAVVTLVVLNVAQIINYAWRIKRLERRFKTAFISLDSTQDLPNSLNNYHNKLTSALLEIKNVKQNYTKLTKIANNSLQKTSLIRFNPFSDTGGDQSFVLALLDNQDNGYLLTSIHGREGTRIYVKPVKEGVSTYQLSIEEKNALTTAKG